MYNYKAVNSLDDSGVCHSEVIKDGTVIVHFELPDKDRNKQYIVGSK